MSSVQLGTAFERLTAACRVRPDAPRLTFLEDATGGDDPSRVTLNGHQLLDQTDRWAAHIADRVRRDRGGPGDRILLAFPAGLDFVTAFLASVRLGLVPVPVSHPKPHRPMSRYQTVMRDSGARWGLTDPTTRSRIGDDGGDVGWMSPDEFDRRPGDDDCDWSLDPAGIDASPMTKLYGGDEPPLFLQYTSGSTADPRGVMVTADNLWANLAAIADGFDIHALPVERRVVCSWLPAYHDMGLIGVILAALVHDGHAVLMSPTSFLQKPSMWLWAIDHFRAATTVAPCFGYRLATSKITPDESAGWDLSCLKTAGCGAEPIDADVMHRFAERFADHGLDRSSLYACYGLAESTLMVTGSQRGGSNESGLSVHHLSRSALRDNRVVLAETNRDSNDDVWPCVDCGIPHGDAEVRIVDPASHQDMGDDRVGEIWVRSSSVAAGYFNRPDESRDVFGAAMVDRLGDTSEGPFLRTGDLGFLHDGSLTVTGRLKDVIILRGQNHYPQDIEATASTAVAELVDTAKAAFGIVRSSHPTTGTHDAHDARDTHDAHDAHGEAGEAAVLICEVPRGWEDDQSEPAVAAIRVAIASAHDLLLDEIVLVRPASLARTSSGKIRRGECRRQWIDDELRIRYRWRATRQLDSKVFPDLTPLFNRPDPMTAVRDRITRVLVSWLAKQTGTPIREVDAEGPLTDFGVDSLMAVEMSNQLQQWLGIELSPVAAWSHPNLAGLADDLARRVIRRAGIVETSAQIDAGELERLLDEIESIPDDQARRMLESSND